ncbi:MAG: beta-galactosidase, partial [Ruminococcus bromii]|nr:beta-galactosidase [Ruminococcus bromii]
MDKLLYGVAYYDEYMPYERLEKDMEMMKAANINVIRIAESTWATEEPENGVFDFTHVERALQAAQKAGL